MRAGIVALAVSASLAFAAGNAQAQDPWAHRHDIHHFHDHDFGVWRGGHWVQGPHAGRVGWWWVVGGTWYFYPAPVYPYPDPYVPPAVVVPAGPPQAQVYYYCRRPHGYYPYVTACRVPWRQVTAAPPPR